MGLAILFLVALLLIVAIGTLTLIHRMRHPWRRTYAVALARRLPTAPSEIDAEGYEQTFTFMDGAQSPGFVIEGQAASGPCVIVSHAWGDSRYGAMRFAQCLLPHASRVVVYDLRGHGESTAKASRLAVVEPDDLLALLEQVDTQGQGVVLFGGSMGAGISLAAAVKAAEADKPSHKDPLPPILGVIMDGGYRHPMEPIHGHLREMRVPTQPFIWLAERHFAFWHGPWDGYDRAGLASRYDAPLWVIHGKEDELCPRASAEQIASNAKRGRFVLLEGGHLDLPWQDPAGYAEALSDFFAEIASTPPATDSRGAEASSPANEESKTPAPNA